MCPRDDDVLDHDAVDDYPQTTVPWMRTYHRVKAPCEEGDYYGERFSIAFFNQPCKDTVIQGPRGKYPAVTGEEFNRKAMELSYKAIKARVEALRSHHGRTPDPSSNVEN